MTTVTKPLIRPETTKIYFDFPVMVNGEEVESVTMRRQTVGDTLDAETTAPTDTQQGQEAALFGILSGVPVEDIVTWDMLDYMKLQEGYSFLMFGNHAKTEKSSEEQSSASPTGQAGAETKSDG